MLSLAQALRTNGVDAVIDQYKPFPELGWRGWMEECKTADWVVVVCTEDYRRQSEIDSPLSTDRGVRWEWQLIAQELYDNKFHNRRIIPVLTPGGRSDHIPDPLKDYTSFTLPDQYLALYRVIMDKPAVEPYELGAPLELPKKTVKPFFVSPAHPTETAGKPALNPYPGLQAFNAEMKDYFFGREEAIAELTGRIQQAQLISVVGPSGTGKSSLVAAGLVPVLEKSFARSIVLRFTPRSMPVWELARSLDKTLPEKRFDLDTTDRMEQISQALADEGAVALRRFLQQLANGTALLVFIDQFEELFTQTNAKTADAFHGLFDKLLNFAKLKIVLTMRDEFMDRLAQWLGAKRFNESVYYLGALEGDALKCVVEAPATKVGMAVEPELVEAIVAESRGMRGALPLIAFTLRELFQRPEGLTLPAYRTIGGLKFAIETQAELIEKALETDPQYALACERLFVELATVIEDKPAPRSPARSLDRYASQHRFSDTKRTNRRDRPRGPVRALASNAQLARPI